MAKFVCMLACLAIIINAGYALKCYQYTNGVKSELVCGNAPPGNVQICLYKKTRDATTKAETITGTCEQVLKDTPIDKDHVKECMKQPTLPNIDVLDCIVCTSDLCNKSGAAANKSMFVLLCLPIMFLFTKYVL